MKVNLPVFAQEVSFARDVQLISTTDLKGIITFANDEFVKISGFSQEELIGQSHNIVRHPDMPPAAFKDLWATVQDGRSWKGMVKNRCKDGRYYWVDAFVSPITEDGEIIGYQSVRSSPSEAYKKWAQQVFNHWNKHPDKPSGFASPLSFNASLSLAYWLPVFAGMALLMHLFGWQAAALASVVGVVGFALLWWQLEPVRRSLADSRQISKRSAMHYIYTGLKGELASLQYALQVRHQRCSCFALRK